MAIRIVLAVASALVAWMAGEQTLARMGRYTPRFYPPVPAPEERAKYQVCEPYGYSSAEWDLNAAILERFLALAGRHRFQPALVFLPAAADLENDRRRRARLGQFAPETSISMSRVTKSWPVLCGATSRA